MNKRKKKPKNKERNGGKKIFLKVFLNNSF